MTPQKNNNHQVVSDVIGHSVALNFYNQKADRMLDDFRVLNNSVEGSGVFTEMVGMFNMWAGLCVSVSVYHQNINRRPTTTRPHTNDPTPSPPPKPKQDKKDLFKLVALNNKILTDAMSSGLLEQSKPAWNFNRLDALWNGACSVWILFGICIC